MTIIAYYKHIQFINICYYFNFFMKLTYREEYVLLYIYNAVFPYTFQQC